ncbi:MAG: CRTAC1 family protein [Deltaproteobacteria bacterium]
MTFLLLASCVDIEFSNPDGDGDGGGSVEIPSFTNVIPGAMIGDVGILGQTASWGDFNNDNCQDLIVGNADSSSSVNVFLFRNNCSGAFTDVTAASGIADMPLRSASWGDFNNDGLLDLIIGTTLAENSLMLYRNMGGGVFDEISDEAGLTEFGIVSHTLWVDFDGDGLLDLFQSNLGESLLYLNNGNETFDEVSALSGIGQSFQSNAAIWFDADNDGSEDLFLANNGINVFYLGDGDGTFTNATATSGLGGDSGWNSVASCVGDYNADGLLDLYVVNIFDNTPVRNALYRNDGDGAFTDVTAQTGTADVGDGRTCAWVDFDADGRVDLFTTNHLNPSRLFRNLGGGEFEDVAPEADIDSPMDVFAAPWGDYNNDGFMDAFLNGHLGEALADNGGNSNNYVIVKLVGDGDATNASAIGSRVQITTSAGSQIRSVSGGKGCCEQDMLPLHFGIGSLTQVNIAVEWTSGAVCNFTSVFIGDGRIISISEQGCQLAELNL